MSPSPSGARLAGDDYQHLHTWLETLKLLDPGCRVTSVSMEVTGAGNVDDLVVKCQDAPTLYHQVKFAVDYATPLTHSWFTTPARRGQASPLKRFYSSFQALSTESHQAELALVTNRPVDPKDPLLRHISGRNETLVRALNSSDESAAGKVLSVWADELEIDRGELDAFLAHLHIRAGEASSRHLVECCGWAMRAAGVRWDEDTVDSAVTAMRTLIQDGDTELDASKLKAILARPAFHAETPQASFVVQAIGQSPEASHATVALDWVDLFDGEEPRARRQLKDTLLWNSRLRPEVLDAAKSIEDLGFQQVRIAGAMRLSTFFVVGAALPETRGLALAFDYHGDEWATTATAEPLGVSTHIERIDQGGGVAIGLSISGAIRNDVSTFLHDQGVPVSRLVDISPSAGSGPRSVSGPGQAITLAREIVRIAREVKADSKHGLHLFMYAPAPLALFLGYLWNRVPSTQLYEDLSHGDPMYAASFVVPG